MLSGRAGARRGPHATSYLLGVQKWRIALAQLKWRFMDQRAMHTPRFARDMIVAVLALVFSILFIVYSRNTGNSFWVYWAPYFLAAGALLLGIPVYLSQRRRMTPPEPVPSYR